MGKNNAHFGESKEARLERLQDSPPHDVIDNLIGSINKHFNNEIAATLDNESNYQTSLMLLGIHAVALTISYALFDREKEDGYRRFLIHFVDGQTQDTKFSEIATEIHGWRNVLAHRWLSAKGHSFDYNFQAPTGWWKDKGKVVINPRIYLDHYLATFAAGGRIYDLDAILTTNEAWESAKMRIISKYAPG